MKSEFRLKRPDPALLAAAIMAAVLMSFAGAPVVHAAENDFGYQRAARLSAQKKHGEALAVLTEGLKQAENREDTRLAFFLARDLSSCHERLGNLNACLEVAETAIGHLDTLDEMEGDYSELDQIEIALRIGQTEGLEARLIAALEKFRDVGNRKGVPARYHDYGSLLMMLGRPGEAIYMYRETLELSLAYGWIVHVPDIMLKLAAAHLALGDTAGATQWLGKAEKHLQANPGIPAHRVAYARASMVGLLRKLDRGEEADALREETLAFTNTNAVPDHHIRHLLHDGKRVPDAPGAVAAVTKAAVGGIDFQPLRVVSEVAPGETALARYTLANLTGAHAAGQLSLPAGIEVVSWDSAAGDMRLRTSDKPQSKLALPVEFGPSEMIRIFVESSQVRGEEPREFSFAWDRPGVAAQTSHWSFSAADSDSELTVVNANLIRHNPFYLVPLYHAVCARDLSQPLRDFRVRCSIPCYVEMIDTATDRVIAVDRHGDGSFREPGDIVYQDENRDLYPDHRFQKAGGVFGLELRVFPADKAGGAEMTEAHTIAIEGLVNGTWEILAENRVERTKSE